MQALAGSALVAGSSAAAVRVQRRSFAGSALRRAAANGSAARCRAFFKFGKKEEGPNNGGVPTDSGACVPRRGERVAEPGAVCEAVSTARAWAVAASSYHTRRPFGHCAAPV